MLYASFDVCQVDMLIIFYAATDVWSLTFEQWVNSGTMYDEQWSSVVDLLTFLFNDQL